MPFPHSVPRLGPGNKGFPKHRRQRDFPPQPIFHTIWRLSDSPDPRHSRRHTSYQSGIVDTLAFPPLALWHRKRRMLFGTIPVPVLHPFHSQDRPEPFCQDHAWQNRCHAELLPSGRPGPVQNPVWMSWCHRGMHGPPYIHPSTRYPSSGPSLQSKSESREADLARWDRPPENLIP